MERGYARATLILFHLALAVVLVTFRDYGITDDEARQHDYGERILACYASGFEDTSARSLSNLYLYGGLFEVGAALAAAGSPLDVFETRHLLNALVGLAAVLGTWQVGRLLGGARAAFLAALLLLLTPRFYGHMFANPKDVPFAAGYIWSLNFLLRLLPHLPRPPLRRLVPLGVAVGLTLAVRAAALLVLAYLALMFALALVRFRPGARRPGERLRVALRLGASLLLVWVVALAVMLPFWPWTHPDPVTRPVRALASLMHFAGWHGSVLFRGEWIRGTDLPPTYIPALLATTLPEGVLALLAAGAVLGATALLSASRRRSPAARRHAWVALAVVFPVVSVAVAGSLLYNGMRHLLFVLPPLVALAASTLHALLTRLEARSRGASRLAAAIFGLYLAGHAVAVASLHPYEYVYYNRLVGGVPGAAGRLELDYWGATLREAVLRLRARLEREARGRRPPDLVLLGPGRPSCYVRFLPEYITLTSRLEAADLVLSVCGFEGGLEAGGRPFVTVARHGTPLAIVWDRRTRGEPVGARTVTRRPGAAGRRP